MIKLITLNIEGNRHLSRVVPFLKKEDADVVCLEEVLKSDVEMFDNELGMFGKFVPTMDNWNNPLDHFKGIWGVLFLSKENVQVDYYYYVGEGKVPVYVNPNSTDRVLVYGTIEGITIGTTHFTWTPNGEANDEQREDAPKLIEFIKGKPFILCGDFNAPRGKETFSKFVENFKDNLPVEVESTIDPVLHKKGDLGLAVDTIFSTPEYTVSKVRVVEGLSDHKGIVAIISKN